MDLENMPCTVLAIIYWVTMEINYSVFYRFDLHPCAVHSAQNTL